MLGSVSLRTTFTTVKIWRQMYALSTSKKHIAIGALRAECCNLYVMIYKPEALIRFISSQTSLPSMNGMGGNFCVWLRETVSKRYPGYIYTKACAEKTAQAFLHISGLRAFPRMPSRVQQPFAGPLGKEQSRPSYLRQTPTFSGQ